jgi:hypothetical protein
MRILLAKDIIPMGKILAKTNLRPMLKEIFSGEKKALGNSELAIELVFKLLESMDIIGTALFEFLAYVENKEVKDIEELSLEELVDLLKELIGDKNFGSFFKLAAK